MFTTAPFLPQETINPPTHPYILFMPLVRTAHVLKLLCQAQEEGVFLQTVVDVG